MTTYWCEACGKECTPVLRDVGRPNISRGT